MEKNQHFELQCKALETQNPQIVQKVQQGFEYRCNAAMRRKVGF
jgi:hypothetical protein